MPKVQILLEIRKTVEEALSRFAASVASTTDRERLAESLLDPIAGLGVELDANSIPVPMFIAPTDQGGLRPLADAFSAVTSATRFVGPEFMMPQTPPPDRPVVRRLMRLAHPPSASSVRRRRGRRGVKPPANGARGKPLDLRSQSMVVACEVERSKLDKIRERSGVFVWPNSELTLLNNDTGRDVHPFDTASSRGGVDCRPFRPGVGIDVIRQLLSVEGVWRYGYRGQNVIVAVIDEGVDGSIYPVVGGFSRPDAGRRWGSAPVTSHGSMCAADILVAAPAARLYDYPFLGIPNSGGALQMLNAVLEQRRKDGTPHLTNNSYGFVGVPDRQTSPNHEVWDTNHPVHRKVREVVAAGVTCFFAAGNCGQDCPSGACHTSGIGPGRSIHASNSLAEVITVAAVNSRHERVGYSS